MSTQYTLTICSSKYARDSSQRIVLDLKPMSDTVMIEDLKHFLVKKVYHDQDYFFELKPNLKIRNVKIHINRYLLNNAKLHHDSGIISTSTAYGSSRFSSSNVFQNIFGTCKIQISFEDNNGHHTLETEPFEVLINEKMDFSRVENMARVIADQADLLLQPQTMDFERDRNNFGTLNSLEERLTYLFMIRSFLFERLTLLRPGRPTGMAFFVIDWLEDLYSYLSELLMQLKAISFSNTENVRIEEGYQRSSAHLKVCTGMAMNRIVSDLEDLQSSFAKLKRELELKGDQTREFDAMSLVRQPEYRQFFEIRSRWNAFSHEKVTSIQFMSMFMEVTALYEGYCLCQLLKYFQSRGYECIHVSKEFYRFVSDEMFQNSVINNVFVLENAVQKITLYYQPAIVGGNQKIKGKTGLIRNTSISYPVNGKATSKGTFYSPDFVIRFQDKKTGVSRYVICDSKFMDMEHAVINQLVPLIYKYLFAISCQSAQDSVDALYVFCGSGMEDGEWRSLYNLADLNHPVFPRVELVVCAQKNQDADEAIMGRFDDMFMEFLNVETDEKD